MSSPANSNAPSPLLDIPLEIRHHIFSHVAAARDVKPRYILRYWFEKADVQEQIAEKLAKDPGANVTYVAGYNHWYDAEDEAEAQDAAVVDEGDGDSEENELQDEDDEDETGGETEGDEDEQDDEDEDHINNEDEEMYEEQDADTNGSATDPNVARDDDNATANVTQGHVNNIAPADNTQTVVDTSGPESKQILEKNEEVADLDMSDSQGEREDAAEAAGVEHEDAQGADTAEAGEDSGSAARDLTEDTPTPKVVLNPNHKWRHVSKFMRFTQCPPQANLFLISKQLNLEAKTWFYDVATLNIDATASFLHFTFFELALNKLAEATFSPMKNIKNAEITFVWDTTWIRAESSGFACAVFPVFLKSRVDFILAILLRAPELEKVKIIWHDSAEDDEAKQLRADTLEPFILNLRTVVETEDHYIAPDAKPRARSRAGKQRVEFQAIIDNGCETF